MARSYGMAGGGAMSRSESPTAWESDWLGSSPVYYNTATRVVGTCLNDVIDWSRCELDPEGFNNYLEFGYSVFGQTPVRHVRFLLPNQRLRCDGDCFRVEDVEDSVLGHLVNGVATAEADVWTQLRAAVSAWERSVSGPILIPTSGGFDSRLLNLLIANRARVRSRTFGPSSRQEQSFEVTRAAELSRILHTDWRHVPLHRYLRHLDTWYDLYGASCHAHGMYQIEFYERLKRELGANVPLLSGIIGDAWGGHVLLPEIGGPARLGLLGWTHGMAADPACSRLRGGQANRVAFWERYRELIAIPEGRVVVAMRMKMLLLSYLYRVPRHFGFQPWSPFLQQDIALAMLCLPVERRQDRQWQRDFFRQNDVDLESRQVRGSWEIDRGHGAVDECPLVPLDADLLGNCVSPAYTRWVNTYVCEAKHSRHVRRRMLHARNRLIDMRPWDGLLYKWGVREKRDVFETAYAAYQTLWPIEQLLVRARRDAH